MSVPRERLTHRDGAGANTAIKWVLTGVALASTAFSGWKGAKQQLRIAQWVTPAVIAVLIVLCDQQVEQQRSANCSPNPALTNHSSGGPRRPVRDHPLAGRVPR